MGNRGAYPLSSTAAEGFTVTMFIAVLTTLGVVAALLSNATNILKFVQDRRERARLRPAGRGRQGISTSYPTPSYPTPGSDAPAGGVPWLPGEQGATEAPRPRPPILTPDQRLRVFISSTLKELADERAAARKAVETLHLTPVLFELGARPHAPSDLYRAYLEQSHVFVGIYWQSYGWVAPGESISGLEDEYRLAGDRPRLIYVKEPAPHREARLAELLEHVRNEATASYRPFTTAAELAEMLMDDVAVLVTERFRDHAGTAARSAAPSGEPDLRLPGLPLSLTSFVGREAQLAELVDMFRSRAARLVTVVGPGGIGKSRLALEACRSLGHAYPDGVAFISLDTVRDPALLPATLLRGLNVAAIAGRDTEDHVIESLSDRRILLVLDNFEGLLEASPLVARLLQRCSNLSVLATSRSLLRLAGEVAFPVGPMRVPPSGRTIGTQDALAFSAVRLFVERAAGVLPGFRLDDQNLPAVLEICRRLDGLPLAIELAAARIRSITAPELLRRMTQVLPLLTDGTRDAPARQRTLEATIDWSYNLLEPSERRSFRHLAVFSGGFFAEAVEAVLLDAGHALDALASLSDKSLLMKHDDGGAARYAMLETIREYALERLADDEEAAGVRERHAQHYLALAERAAPELSGAQQATWLTRLRLEVGNLRAAFATFLDIGAADEALRMGVALRAFWVGVGAVAEGRALLKAALAIAHDASPSLLAWGTGTAGVLAWRQGDIAAARPLVQAALEGFRTAADVRGEATASRALGMLSHNQARYREAEELLGKSLALYRSISDREGVANTLLSLGNVHLDQGDRLAEDLYRESRTIAAGISDTLGIAHAVDNLGVAAWYFDRPDEAARLSDEALELYSRLDHPTGIANVAHRRGLLAFGRGHLDAADTFYREALATRRALGDARGCAFVLYDLARVALRRDDLQKAQALLREGFALAREQVARVIEVLYLEGAAALLDRSGRDAEAYVLLLAAGSMRVSLGVPVAPVNRSGLARRLQRLKRTLDHGARSRAETDAADLPYEAALARAEAVLQQSIETPEASG